MTEADKKPVAAKPGVTAGVAGIFDRYAGKKFVITAGGLAAIMTLLSMYVENAAPGTDIASVVKAAMFAAAGICAGGSIGQGLGDLGKGIGSK
jgi:hypothetical protein